MCNFDCFNCKLPDCVLSDDEIGLYTRYEGKLGHEMAAMITKRYIEYKERYYAEHGKGSDCRS